MPGTDRVGPGRAQAQGVQRAAEGPACMTCSQVGRGWAVGAPRGEITFLAFPTAGAGARAQVAEPKDGTG